MRGGRLRYVVLPLDEGDEEVLTIQQNAALMAYLAECSGRGRKGPTKSLAQLNAELDREHGACVASSESPG